MTFRRVVVYVPFDWIIGGQTDKGCGLAHLKISKNIRILNYIIR